MRYDCNVAPPSLLRELPDTTPDVPVDSMRTEQLLATLIRCSLDQARDILEKTPLPELSRADYATLTAVMAPRRARLLVVAFELAKRGLQRMSSSPSAINCPADVLPFLWDIRTKPREHFVALYLNARNQLIHKEVIFIGSLSASIVHPREVLHVAVARCAASIILGHNHPSGDTSPSRDDTELTRRLVQAGEILGIEIVDHIIVGPEDHLSMKERGLL